MMSNSEARKRAAEVVGAASESDADLADLIHSALEGTHAPAASGCPEDDEGFVGCFAAAHAILSSDWLAAHTAAARAEGAMAVFRAVLAVDWPLRSESLAETYIAAAREAAQNAGAR